MVRWGLYKDKGFWVIRRGFHRLPIGEYSRIRDNETLLRELVLRLNAPIRAKEMADFKHALINEARLDEYKDYLSQRVEALNARCEYNFLVKHCLNYFIGKMHLLTPNEWLHISDTKWAAYLRSNEVAPAPKTKRAIVQAANRFIQWMHKKYPEFMPDIKLEPFSPAAYKRMVAEWKLNPKATKRGIITDAHWQLMLKSLPDIIAPYVKLAYYYGVRRAEALGLLPGDVKNSYLGVERQLRYITPKPSYGPLKGRDHRKVPHWFSTNAFAYDCIDKAHKLKPITKTEFSNLWADYMKTLGLKYQLHELRHTFITKAVRLYPIVDVMHAAGHKNIETTMKYLHDDRTLDDAEYKPTG